MFKAFVLTLFKLCGWKAEGHFPEEIHKCVVVGAPHTSNFDLIFAMAGFYKVKMPVKYLIKQEWLDFWPLRKILKGSGAIGIKRDRNRSMVDTLANTITSYPGRIALLITPEGTRKLTKVWKTGFYQAALKAKVPIVLTHLDYATKTAAVAEHFFPSGCYKRDMQILRNHYKNITARYPENFSLQIYSNDEDSICQA